MRFAVDTWAPEYGIAADATHLDPSTATVDVSVERSADDWAPISPLADSPSPESIAFVDGVRRFDARVWINSQDGRVRPGVCASVAAGVVRCTASSAVITAVEVRRGLFAASGSDATSIATRHATYEFFPVSEDTDDGLYLGVHERMTALESALSGEDAELVIFDGPLRGRSDVNGVGFIKTQQVQYLPDELQVTVMQLSAGQRTPLFLFEVGGFTRWSWYLRLPCDVSHPLSGIVRCELPAVGSIDQAAEWASVVSSALPRFASEPHKDPRSPQNLYPIAGLERELRHRLGDQLLLERALRTAASEY